MNIKQFIFLSCIWMMTGVNALARTGQKEPLHIIPQPVSVTIQDGYFLLEPDTRILVSGIRMSGVASMLVRMLETPTGYPLAVKQNEGGQVINAIVLRINTTSNAALGDEGYTLQVTPQQVIIAANKPQGLFYGIQTLMQLLPPGIESTTVVHDVKWQIPCVNILDYPRFGWRGMMLDVSRHFFTVKEVKEYIDEIAKYKFNVFHWHLTDDQGWRIQIEGLPELTKTGAWRVPRMGRWGSFEDPRPGEKATYGGFYTQQDIQEVVRYAQKRFVTIVPEIDVPAHSLALIASYPDLSCTKLQYDVNPGSQLSKKKIDNVLCVGNDSTWLILNKIFTQVVKLFPGEYIHVGGDEAYKGFWGNCPKDKMLMKSENVTGLEGLQSYFIKKLEKLIVSKGKKVIGWDEILEGGLAPGAAVMSWRGMKGGIKAAQMGHHVVMSPYGSAYLSQLQGNPLIEPNGPGMTRMRECYALNILPEGIDTGMVLGGEGCLWTEHVPNFRHAEYMTWPRAMALSEVFWSPGNKHDWADLVRRVEWQFKYLDAAHVKYAHGIYDPIITPLKDNKDSFTIKLSTEIPGLDIYYRFDGTDPDNFSPKYKGEPLKVPKGASQIRIVTYRNGKSVGCQVNCPLSYLEEKLKKSK